MRNLIISSMIAVQRKAKFGLRKWMIVPLLKYEETGFDIARKNKTSLVSIK